MNLTRTQAIELAEEIIHDASLYATPTELANAIADEWERHGLVFLTAVEDTE